VVTINAVPTANISYGNDSLCDIGSVDALEKGSKEEPIQHLKKSFDY
jgi:hypothetical protein